MFWDCEILLWLHPWSLLSSSRKRRNVHCIQKHSDVTSQNQLSDKINQRISNPRNNNKNTNFCERVYNQHRNMGSLTGKRRQGPILPTHTMRYNSTALPRLATTERSLIYMIIGGLGTLWQTFSDDEAERRGTMPSGACRQSDPRCNLLRKRTRKSGKRKRMRQIRVFMRETI